MMFVRDRCGLMSLCGAMTVLMIPAAPTFSQTVSPEPTGAVSAVTDRAGARIAIASTVTVRVVESRLEDVLAHLEAITPIRFEPMWADRQHAGLDPELLVSLDLTERPVQEVLERLIEQIGDDFSRAAWQIGRDGRVQIGPKSRLNQRTEIVFYDLHDLVFEIPQFVDVPTIDLQAAMQQGGGSSQPPFSDPGDEPKTELSRAGAEEIADLVAMFVEPLQWVRNGGEGAMMRIWNQQLIVRAPRYVLRQIDALSR